MSERELNALRVSPPVEPHVRTTVTSSERFMLPKKFHGSWIALKAVTVDVEVRFTVGTSALTPTADGTARSSVSSNEITPAANATLTIAAGETVHFDLSVLGIALEGDSRIWLCHISASTSGKLEFWKSSGPKGN